MLNYLLGVFEELGISETKGNGIKFNFKICKEKLLTFAQNMSVIFCVHLLYWSSLSTGTLPGGLRV